MGPMSSSAPPNALYPSGFGTLLNKKLFFLKQVASRGAEHPHRRILPCICMVVRSHGLLSSSRDVCLRAEGLAHTIKKMSQEMGSVSGGANQT